MPLLAAWIGSLFGGIFTFFTALVGKKLAFTLALVTATAAAFAAMLAATNAAASSVVEIVPAFVAMPASWILPNNISECISARIAASIAIFAYRWHRDTILMATSGA